MAKLTTYNRIGIRVLLTLLLLISFGPTALPQSIQRSDAAQLAANLGASLQIKLATLVGPGRTIVSVDVTVSDRFTGASNESVQALNRLPGVVAAPPSALDQAALDARINSLSSQISSIHIIIEADDSLPESDLGTPPEYDGKISQAVARWSKLNRARGDTLRVIPTELGVFTPPSASQQSYLLYSILALVALLILIAAIYFPMRKAKGGAGTDEEDNLEDRARLRKEEMEEIAKMFATSSSDTSEYTLSAIKDLMEQHTMDAMTAGGSGGESVSVLEEIKDLLGNPPQESDSLLTEMRDTLSDMLDETRKVGPRGGVMPAGTPGASAQMGGGGGGGAGAGPAFGGGAMADDAAVDSMKTEIVSALGNLEELMAQQLEKAPGMEGVEQPFKYLKKTDPEEIILLINDEEPKLAAAVLSQIEPTAAAAVFEGLDEEKQFEMARAMTQLTEEEDMASEIKDFLERKLKIVRLHKDYVPVTGTRVLADILSTSRYAVAMVMLEKMEGKNPAMAAEVRKLMFLFEDIKTLEDKDVEILINNLSEDTLAYSLAETEDDIRAKFFRNMTDKAQDMIKEDIETVKKVKLEEEGQELPFNKAIMAVDQTIIDEIFRTVERTTLKMALRGASEEVQEKFFTGLTERAVAMMREDLEVMGGISRARADEAQDEIMDILRQLSSKTLAAQHEIIATIRKLEHEGQISVPRFQEETV